MLSESVYNRNKVDNLITDILQLKCFLTWSSFIRNMFVLFSLF